MKKSIYTFGALGLLTFSLIASSQEEALQKFDLQTLWTSVKAETSDRNFQFHGFETTRKSFRLNPLPNVLGANFRLEIEAKKPGIEAWTKSCKSLYDRERLRGYGKIKLFVSGNPWATEQEYKLTKADGTSLSVGPAQIENAPKVSGVKVVLTGHPAGLTSELHAKGYARYIQMASDELNEQLKTLNRESYFLKYGLIEFDLSEGPLRFLACDLGLDYVDLKFAFDLVTEPAKAPQKIWITPKEHEKIYQDLADEETLKSGSSPLRVGLFLGMNLEKIRSNFDIHRSKRDEKLVRSLFEADLEDKNKLTLKSLSPDDLAKAFAGLPEIDLSSFVPQKQTAEVYKRSIQIEFGE